MLAQILHLDLVLQGDGIVLRFHELGMIRLEFFFVSVRCQADVWVHVEDILASNFVFRSSFSIRLIDEAGPAVVEKLGGWELHGCLEHLELPLRRSLQFL